MSQRYKDILRQANSSRIKHVYNALIEIRKTYIKSDKGVEILVSGGLIERLVKLLQTWQDIEGDYKVKVTDISLSILGNMCMSEVTRKQVLKINGIIAIVQLLLDCDIESIQNRCCRCLANILLSPGSWTLVHDTPVVERVVKLLGDTENNECKQTYIRAIRLLGQTSKHVQTLLDKQCVSVVGKHLDPDQDTVCQSALRCLLSLSNHCCNPDFASQVVSSGKLNLLLTLSKARNTDALQLILHLCNLPNFRPDFGNTNGIDIFAEFFKSDEEFLTPFKKDCINVLTMCCKEAVNRVKLRESGCLEIFLSALSDDTYTGLHGRIISALVCFLYDQTSFDILLENGLVDVLIQQLKRYMDLTDELSVDIDNVQVLQPDINEESSTCSELKGVCSGKFSDIKVSNYNIDVDTATCSGLKADCQENFDDVTKTDDNSGPNTTDCCTDIPEDVAGKHNTVEPEDERHQENVTDTKQEKGSSMKEENSTNTSIYGASQGFIVNETSVEVNTETELEIENCSQRQVTITDTEEKSFIDKDEIKSDDISTDTETSTTRPDNRQRPIYSIDSPTYQPAIEWNEDEYSKGVKCKERFTPPHDTDYGVFGTPTKVYSPLSNTSYYSPSEGSPHRFSPGTSPQHFSLGTSPHYYRSGTTPTQSGTSPHHFSLGTSPYLYNLGTSPTGSGAGSRSSSPERGLRTANLNIYSGITSVGGYSPVASPSSVMSVSTHAYSDDGQSDDDNDDNNDDINDDRTSSATDMLHEHSFGVIENPRNSSINQTGLMEFCNNTDHLSSCDQENETRNAEGSRVQALPDIDRTEEICEDRLSITEQSNIANITSSSDIADENTSKLTDGQNVQFTDFSKPANTVQNVRASDKIGARKRKSKSHDSIVFENNILILLSTISQMTNPKYLVTKETLLTLIQYIKYMDAPLARAARLLSRVFSNPVCFETLLHLNIPTIIFEFLLVGGNIQSLLATAIKNRKSTKRRLYTSKYEASSDDVSDSDRFTLTCDSLEENASHPAKRKRNNSEGSRKSHQYKGTYHKQEESVCDVRKCGVAFLQDLSEVADSAYGRGEVEKILCENDTNIDLCTAILFITWTSGSRTFYCKTLTVLDQVLLLLQDPQHRLSTQSQTAISALSLMLKAMDEQQKCQQKTSSKQYVHSWIDKNFSENSGIPFNRFPNSQNLDSSNLEAAADNKTDVDKDKIHAQHGTENIEASGENADKQHFLLLPQCFPKPSSSGTSKLHLALLRMNQPAFSDESKSDLSSQNSVKSCNLDALSGPDLKFSVEGETILADRKCLSKSSDIFMAMLDGRFSESKQSSISISDTSKAAFEYIIHFLHGCRLANCKVISNILTVEVTRKSTQTLIDILTEADKYLLNSLKRALIEVLNMRYIVPESAMLVLKFAILHGDESLQKSAVWAVMVDCKSNKDLIKFVNEILNSSYCTTFLQVLEDIIVED